jgi:hypothetical protein
MEVTAEPECGELERSGQLARRVYMFGSAYRKTTKQYYVSKLLFTPLHRNAELFTLVLSAVTGQRGCIAHLTDTALLACPNRLDKSKCS